jgi:putative heme transporter
MDDDHAPASLRLAAGIAWRLIVIAGAVAMTAVVLATLRIIILPVVVALMLATLFMPPVRWLRGRGWSSVLASLAALLASLAVFAARIAVLVPVTAGQLTQLGNIADNVQRGVELTADWLVEGPFGLPEEQVDGAIARAQDELRDSAAAVIGGVFSGALVLLEVIIGAVLTVVLLFFFLKDGPRMWAWVSALFPQRQRSDVNALGGRAWWALGAYLRAQVVVALVDAVLIGLVLLVLGVPLAIPLALLIFFGGFVPIVGAFVTGFAAVMVALASNGFTVALIVLAAVVVVQQLEGNLLEPLLVGHVVNLHPAVVLLAVTAGATIWGIPGAFVAVPVAAVAHASVTYLRERNREDVHRQPVVVPPPGQRPEGGPPDLAGT